MKTEPAPRKLTDFDRPEQILELIPNERLRSLISTIAQRPESAADDIRPGWAIRAASEFWRCCQEIPRSKRANLENYKLGYMWGFVSRLSPKPLEIPPALAAILEPETIGALLHAEIAKASAPEASEFYAGLSDGLKRENFSPPAPYIIYLVLALAWPEVSVLKNMTQIHGWLEQHLGSNLTGSRDRIAKICQKIRLPLTDKGGRPKGKPRNRPTS